MKLPCTQEKNRGFTLVELLVVFAVIAVIAVLLLPGFADRQPKPLLALCTQNLKQIGLANLLWNQDYSNGFPSLVSTNNFGTREYLLNGQVNMHFQALAPYFGSYVQITCCPADRRKPAANFSVLQNTNLSYFVSLDSILSNATSIAAGDRNFETDGQVANADVTTWTTTNTACWAPGLHNQAGRARGNFLFSDGHVERVEQYKLAKLTRQLGTNTIRFAIP